VFLVARPPWPFAPLVFFVPAAFLPGLPSTLATTFLTAPSTFSFKVGFLGVVAVADFFVTPAPVLGLGAAFFFVVVLRLRAGSVETAVKIRGFELPVVPRVCAISGRFNGDNKVCIYAVREGKA